MSLINKAVEEFGLNLGLKGLDVPEKGQRALTFSKRGTLVFERKPTGLLISVFKQYPHIYDTTFHKALSLSAIGLRKFYNISAALKGVDVILFSAFLEMPDINPQYLAEVFDQLTILHQELNV